MFATSGGRAVIRSRVAPETSGGVNEFLRRLSSLADRFEPRPSAARRSIRRGSVAAALAAGLVGSILLPAIPASAAPTDVVINEMMYHGLSDLDGDDYLELANSGTTPVDLSGWSFSGITLILPAGTTMAAGGFSSWPRTRRGSRRPTASHRRRSTRQPLQQRRDRHREGRGRDDHRLRQLPRRRPVAGYPDGLGPLSSSSTQH